VQLLRSLFCTNGFDNRVRFLTISGALYLVFIMLASAFTSQIILSVIIMAVFGIILALTTLRRLHDALLNKNWLFAPTLSFLLVAMTIIFSQQHSSYYLLFIPALCSATLLTYASKMATSEQVYTLGYIGPVDMSEYQQSTHLGKSAKFRIEPSLVADVSVDLEQNQHQQTVTTEYLANHTQQNSQNFAQHLAQASNSQADIGEQIRLNFLANKKAQIILLSLLGVTLAVIVASMAISFFSSTFAHEQAEVIPPQQVGFSLSQYQQRAHPLAMPDNFTLFLSPHQGLIINWQADEVNEGLLWSQVSSKGDQSCQQITFNKGNAVRTLAVEVSSQQGVNTDYYASFSPLDSQVLIQALAFKNSFLLCGYKFSLKGSQAALGKHERYANLIDY